MSDPYSGREQTKTKHFVLKRYLEALAFKVLNFFDITYIDGFSGPWKTQTGDFADSSFMIALRVLKDAQKRMAERRITRRIRCFFSEADPKAYAQLKAAVAPFHNPAEGFEVMTYCGKFEDAVHEINTFIGDSFPLIFIDPTGWTGYPLDKLRPLFDRQKCEVVINFMYEFVNRFAYSDDADIVASLDPILGGPGWRDRLDHNLSRGAAVEKLFRETLESVWNLKFVVSTKIDKPTAERPHFFITYGTKSRDGLKAFRETEYAALREHAKSRVAAQERKRADKSRTSDMFSDHHAEVKESTIDEIVQDQKVLAATDLLAALTKGAMQFYAVVEHLLRGYMLRETNVKDICVALAKERKIENTWGSGNRKPSDTSTIRLKAG